MKYAINITILYSFVLLFIIILLYRIFFNKNYLYSKEFLNTTLLNTDPFTYPQTICSIDSDGNLNRLSFPTGFIIMWNPSEKTIDSLSSLINLIPTGWAICDGTQGTPDLRGRFVLMAQDSIPVEGTIPNGSSVHAIGSIGGEEKHILDINEIPNHNHGGGGSSGGVSATNTESVQCSQAGVTSITGGSESHNILPPYYTIVFLMKL